MKKQSKAEKEAERKRLKNSAKEKLRLYEAAVYGDDVDALIKLSEMWGLFKYEELDN